MEAMEAFTEVTKLNEAKRYLFHNKTTLILVVIYTRISFRQTRLNYLNDTALCYLDSIQYIMFDAAKETCRLCLGTDPSLSYSLLANHEDISDFKLSLSLESDFSDKTLDPV